MNTAPRESIEISGESGHQGLAFTRAHFGNFSLVERHATDELHLKVPLADGADGRRPRRGKRFRQHFIQRVLLSLTLLGGIFKADERLGQARAELIRLGAQICIAQVSEARLEGIDFVDQLRVLLNISSVGGAGDRNAWARGANERLLGLSPVEPVAQSP